MPTSTYVLRNTLQMVTNTAAAMVKSQIPVLLEIRMMISANQPPEGRSYGDVSGVEWVGERGDGKGLWLGMGKKTDDLASEPP